MKKVLYSLLTLAAALTVSSCLKEVERSADPVLGGPTVEAEFTLNLDQLLTKAYADGAKATKLSYAFFDAEGTVVESLSARKIAIPDANKINVKLSKGVAYTFVAWVESASSVYTISSDFKTVTMATTGLTANNDNYDAFYGTVAISSDDTKTTVSKEVELKRPFAQINLLVPDANTVEYTSFKSAMTVKSAYTSMNLLTGALDDPTDITFASASASATEPTIKTGHKYLAMNYVFASADAANFPVSFTVTPDDNAAEVVTVDLASVSLKRNRRTNLVGNIFKTQVDGSITITINPTVVDPAEEEVLPTLQLALPAGATSAGPSAVNLPLTVGAGAQTVGMSSPNSDGAISFDLAANESIAKVEDNHDGTATVTPLANGTTTFVGHIAAGNTKADFSAVDVIFTVVVSGGVAPTTYNVTIADMTNGTVTSDKATAAADQTVTLTISPDDGYALNAISVQKVGGGEVSLSGEGNTRSFTMPAEAVTVSATFALIPAQTYAVTVEATTNGTVTSDKATAAADQTVTLTISPDDGYALNAISVQKVGGGEVSLSGEGNTRSFTMPAEAVTVSATFAADDAESVVYTLTPATGSNNNYAANCDIEIGGISWNLTGNSQMIPWRIGGKSLSSVDRVLYSKNAISEDISKIAVSHGEASSITVNSVTLVVASDSSFETVVSEISKNDFAASSTMTFNRPDGKSWANCYYKFVYNVTVSGNNNKFLEFVGADFTGK